MLALIRCGRVASFVCPRCPPSPWEWAPLFAAEIQGPQDTPYEHGTFLLDLQIPQRSVLLAANTYATPRVLCVGMLAIRTPLSFLPPLLSSVSLFLAALSEPLAGSWRA